jgi:two-component system OmpR family response regulator
MNDTTANRILVVDDEPHMREMLVDLLESAGYRVTAVANGAAMQRELAAGDCALVLLDLRLKGEDGLTLARSVRRTSIIPIIILTGKGDETDRILGLELAADDFLMKPFNPRELLARVRALLRRATELSAPRTLGEDQPPHERYGFGGWVLDVTARQLLDAQGAPCTLTPGEFQLLEALMRHPNCVLTRDQLLEHTRGVETEVFDRTVDVLILRLRRKIEKNPRQPSLIRTERGLGYIFTAVVTRR